MSELRISDLPEAITVGGADLIEIEQDGVSKRGTLAQIVVNRSTVVTYYVATTGLDTNNGLTAATPVLTIQKAVDLCAATAAYSAGPFVIQAAAGTYTVPDELAYDWWLFLASPVTISGAVDGGGIPTVIIQGSIDGTRTHGFIAGTKGVRFTVRDVLVRSFSSAFGFGQQSTIYLQGRVDARNCGRVVSLGLQGIADVGAGDWDGRDLAGVMIPDGQGILALQQASFDLQQASFADLRIHHVDRACVLADGVAGHFNRVLIEDCRTGLHLTRGSGSPNQGDMVIRRCKVGVFLDTRVPPNISNAFDFGQNSAGTSTASTIGGNTLTVGGTVTGIFRIGQTIGGAGIPAGTTILKRGTGSGGAGTYTLSASLTIAPPQAINAAYGGVTSTASTIAGTALTFGGTVSGTPLPGQTVTGAGIPEKVHLVAQTGANSWTIDTPLTVAAQAIGTNNGCDDNILLTSAPTTAVGNVFGDTPRPVFHYPQPPGGTITGTGERTLFSPFSIIAAAPRDRDWLDFDMAGNCNGLAGTATLRLYLGAVAAGTAVATIILPATTAYWSILGGIWNLDKTNVEGRIVVNYGTAGGAAAGTPKSVAISTTDGAGKLSLTADTPVIWTVELSNGADSIGARKRLVHFTYAQVTTTDYGGDEGGGGGEP